MKSERYAYDAAGRLVREGEKTYRYCYLDKVLSVTDGKRSYAYAYHVDGQLARADYGEGDGGRAGSPLPAGSEAFLWDGLALVRRGDESFVNEPHAGDAPKKLCFGGQPRAKRSARRARKGPRGNPVVSSKGATYFNDVLGTTVGVREGRGASWKGAKRRYTAAALTAFGEPVPVAATSHNSNIRQFDHSIISAPFFTGKPQVEGLGRVFLCRNYRADLAKWQTADPLGYPDGWNQLAYCGNEVTRLIDFLGCKEESVVRFDTIQVFYPGFIVIPWYNDEWDSFGLAKREAEKAGKSVKDWVNDKLKEYKDNKNNGKDADGLMSEFTRYFANQQGSDYSEAPPGDNEEPWKSIRESMEAEGWTLEFGPQHAGLALDYDNDVTNAGLGALIISGGTHHWTAKFVKE